MYDTIIKKNIRHVINHECRHSNQFEFIEKHGLNINQILWEENLKRYGTGRLEIDANLAASGIKIPLRFLFRKELKSK